MELTERLEQLNRHWPDLEWQRARLLECDHDVVILDENYVFRFECERNDHEPLEREIRFLSSLHERHQLSIPEYVFVDESYRVGGYRLISGNPLELSIWDELSVKKQHQIATELARILNAVHSSSGSEAESFGVRLHSYDLNPGGRAKNCLQFSSRVIHSGFLTESEKAFCLDFTERFSDPERHKVECLRVIQGEFDWPHILHEEGFFTGFIDFGGIAIGDPAADFHKLWELGEDLVDVMLAHYEYNTEDLKERSHFLALGHALGQMEMGYKRRREDAWSRGYRFFPEGVASPDRIRRAW